jgi:hypothetical protein
LNDYSQVALGKKQDAQAEVPLFVGTSSPTEMVSPELMESALLKVASESTAKKYPEGLFMINETPVRFLPKGSSLRSLAAQEKIPLAALLEYNELRQDTDVLKQDQLIYLRRKPETGEDVVYVVEEEEDMCQLAQRLGVRLENLLRYNQMTMNMRPAVGEKIYLQRTRPGRVRLANSK